MKNKFLKATFLLTSLALSACVKPGNSSATSLIDSSNSQTSQTSAYDAPVTNLKTALKHLNAGKNYTASVKLNGTYYYSIFVTPSYIGTDDDYHDALDFLIADGEGIYSLNKNKGYLVSGEYKVNGTGENYVDLFDNNTAKTLYGVSTSYVDSIGEQLDELTITDKNYKLALLDYIGIDRSSYIDLGSVTAKYNEELSITLQFDARTSYTYVLTFSNFGATNNAVVEDFLAKGGTYFIPDFYITEFKRLVSANNYVRYIYDFDSGTDGDFNGLSEVFNPYYFYSTGGDYKDNTAAKSGYISFNKTEPVTDTSSPYYIPGFSSTPRGIYMFMLQNNRVSFSPQTAYEEPDMEYFMHYPSRLKLMQKTQYFYEGVLREHQAKYTKTDHCYILDDEALMKDFALNFSLDTAFPFDTCKPYALGVEFLLGKKDVSSMIVFHYCFTYNGTKKDYPIPLTAFGDTKNELLDNFYNFYND